MDRISWVGPVMVAMTPVKLRFDVPPATNADVIQLLQLDEAEWMDTKIIFIAPTDFRAWTFSEPDRLVNKPKVVSVPIDEVMHLNGIFHLGGDALEDSERLYE